MRVGSLVLLCMLVIGLSGCVTSMEFSVRVENDGARPATYVVTITEPDRGPVLYRGNLSVEPGKAGVLEPVLDTDQAYVEVSVTSSLGPSGTWDLDTGAACGSCILWVNDDGTRLRFSQDVLD